MVQSRKKGSKNSIVTIDGSSLTIDDLVAVAKDEAGVTYSVVLSERSRKEVLTSRRFIEASIGTNEPVYGVNTGFGSLSQVRIPDSKLEQLQYNLIRSHCVGVGAPLSVPEVRAIILLRANTLARGYSGVSLELVESLLRLLETGVSPVVPEKGSVGASGDLAPLAHLALALIGEGESFFGGKRMASSKALRLAGLQPYKLKAKEGLSLINGTQVMTAIGALAWHRAHYLAEIADVAGAMSLEGLKGSLTPFDKDLNALRPHPGQSVVASHMRQLVSGSKILDSHSDCGKVQDPYSLRCIPQVHGVARDTLAVVRGVLETEMNSVTDNPIVFARRKEILSGGNFHGEYVGVAMDQLAIAIHELANISEQRIEKLINPQFSGLPAFLIEDGGLNSGFMIVQVAAASLVSENKILCHPASVDSIPTSADKEDHVSMGTIAARKCRQVVENVEAVLAMEVLCASTAMEFLRPLRSSESLESVMTMVRNVVPKIVRDRAFYIDIQAIVDLIRSRALYTPVKFRRKGKRS